MLVGSAAGVDLAQIPTAGANLDTMLLEHQLGPERSFVILGASMLA
jgi:hypothetical protein